MELRAVAVSAQHLDALVADLAAPSGAEELELGGFHGVALALRLHLGGVPHHVAALMEAGKPVTTDVAALKMFSTERCGEICAAARQLHGAKGLTTGSEVDRCFRDAQFLTIGEGTSEICRIVVSKALYRTEPGAL